MRRQAGYAIAEVLVAVVIISISFIQLSGAVSKIMRNANQTILAGKSIFVANSTLEEVMAQPFDAKGSEANGYALIFDGSGDYVDLGDVFNGVQTISFWVEADDITSRTDHVLDLNGTDYVKIVNGEITVNNIDNPTYYINGVSGNQTIASIDAWYHVAITTETGINASAVTIGRVAGQTPEYFDGKIDEVRLWNDVRTATEIIDNYRKSIANPYNDSNLKLYLRMNNGSGTSAYDHSASMKHGSITNATWTDASSSWTATLGKEGESGWNNFNDVDDFYKSGGFSDTEYSQLGGRVYAKYVVVNPTSWAVSDADPGVITDYKQITVKVGIPGSTDSTLLSAIKSAKIIQNYGLTYSPYGN